MLIALKLQWRWKLLLSSSSPLRRIKSEIMEETLSWRFHCVMGFSSSLLYSQSLSLGKRKAVPNISWHSVQYTRAVTLTIHSLEDKSNVSIYAGGKKAIIFDIWAVIPMEQLVCLHQGYDVEWLFKEWCALIWQSQTCFKSGTLWRAVTYYALYILEKVLKCALFVMLKVGFCKSITILTYLLIKFLQHFIFRCISFTRVTHFT